MKIRIGQVFRVSHTGPSSRSGEDPEVADYGTLTRGTCDVGADINKGIWAYRPVQHPPEGTLVRPAVILLSNPLKEDTVDSPWVDVVDPDNGFALYNGDNHASGQDPLATRGNALFSQIAAFYTDPTLRHLAPPVLLFTQQQVGSARKGYRQFAGYGVPTRYLLRSQREKNSSRYFTNLAIELALFGLESENEQFDWAWVDARRDPAVGTAACLRLAPAAWRRWVSGGENVIERCRRRLARRRVVSVKDQLDMPPDDADLLEKLVKLFTPKRHAFEGLASFVAQRVIGDRCTRGWVTKCSGDGGIDFVCRLDVGSEFSQSSIVVLGQAKCRGPKKCVSGGDLARVAARLQRGWLGVYVTTCVFSEAAQEELYDDGYPLILINGKRVAREIRRVLNVEGITLQELVEREQAWYEKHLGPTDACRISHPAVFGTEIDLTSGVMSRLATASVTNSGVVQSRSCDL